MVSAHCGISLWQQFPESPAVTEIKKERVCLLLNVISSLCEQLIMTPRLFKFRAEVPIRWQTVIPFNSTAVQKTQSAPKIM